MKKISLAAIIGVLFGIAANAESSLNGEAPTNHFGAEPSDILNAPCRTTPASISDIEKWITNQRADGSPLVSRSIGGFEFSDEHPQFLTIFEKIATKLSLAPSGRINTCKNVPCAMNEILGTPNGIQILYIYAKHGVDTSPKQVSSDRSAWFSTEELTEIDSALEDLPVRSVPTKKVTISYHPGRKGSIAGITMLDEIGLTGVWRAWEPVERRVYAIVHEIGHFIDGHFSALNSSADWLDLGGWTKLNQWAAATLKDPSKAISVYGMSQPFEDFAESVAAYRYNPTALFEKNKGKYEFIRFAAFDGVEFRSRHQCDGAIDLTSQLFYKFQSILRDPSVFSLMDSYLEKAWKINSPTVRRAVIERFKFKYMR